MRRCGERQCRASCIVHPMTYKRRDAGPRCPNHILQEWLRTTGAARTPGCVVGPRLHRRRDAGPRSSTHADVLQGAMPETHVFQPCNARVVAQIPGPGCIVGAPRVQGVPPTRSIAWCVMPPTRVVASGEVNEVVQVHQVTSYSPQNEKYLWIKSESVSMARGVRRSSRGIGNAEVTDVTAAPLHSVAPP